MKDIWNGLLEFETRDLVSNYFDKRFDRKASATKIREITSNFIQGREYFKSAEQADFTVKPLLLYYGVMALSRGLVLSCSPHLSESALKPSHGLEVKNWREALKEKDFGSLEISLTNGSLMELLKATDNKSYFRDASSGVNRCFKTELPQAGQHFTFLELFKSFPDFAQEYKVWRDEDFKFARFKEFQTLSDVNKRKVTLDLKTDLGLLEELFPSRYCGVIETESTASELIVFCNDTFVPNPVQKWQGTLDIGDVYFVPPFEQADFYLNSLSSMYVLSYVLGMTARYFPSTWISLGRVEKGDRIYPLFKKSISFLMDVYPKAILDFLRGPYDFEART